MSRNTRTTIAAIGTVLVAVVARMLILLPPQKASTVPLDLEKKPAFAVFNALCVRSFSDALPTANRDPKESHCFLVGSSQSLTKCELHSSVDLVYPERLHLKLDTQVLPEELTYQREVLDELAAFLSLTISDSGGSVLSSLQTADTVFYNFDSINQQRASVSHSLLYTCGTRTGWISLGCLPSHEQRYLAKFKVVLASTEYPECTSPALQQRFRDTYPKAQDTEQLTKP